MNPAISHNFLIYCTYVRSSHVLIVLLLFRHHGDKRLLDERGSVSIVTQRVVGEGAAVSTLTLLNSTPERAGVYTCRPEHLDPAYIRLHIVEGKEVGN